MNKHKMSKKLLATIMTFAMLITMFPSGVLAAPEGGGNSFENGQVVFGTKQDPVPASANGVTVNKYVTGNAKDGYKLTLEGYASNELTTTSTSTPLDIVLVLDVSGSMDDSFGDGYWQEGQYVQKFDDNWSYNELYSRTYYYLDGNEYREVYVVNEGGIGIVRDPEYVLRFSDTHQQVPGSLTSSERDGKLYEGILYYYEEGEWVEPSSALEALQTAANEFIDSVNMKNQSIPDENNKHRISIVKFADNSYANKIGDNKGTNSTQVVKDFTYDADSLSTAINALHAEGATAADYGLNLASIVLSGGKVNPWAHDADSVQGARENAKKVVVFFTDGDPNHHSGFDGTVANSAIKTAKELKTDTTIYTVGIFEGANPDGESNSNKYMNAVSSNYPWAESYINLGWSNPNNKDYFFAADDAESLTNVFEGIAEDVTTETLEVYPDEESELTDTLSQYFNLPAGITKDDVTVKYVPAKDYNTETHTFTFDESQATETLPDENGNVGAGQALQDIINVEIDEETENIKVTGFDYKEYAASYEANDDGTCEVSGGKLVVTFPIDVDVNECITHPANENLFPTNDTSDSRAKLVYKESAESDKTTATVLSDSPKVYFNNGYLINGSPVTISVYVDGEQVDNPQKYVAIDRNTDDTTYDYFDLSDPDGDGVMTAHFNYNPTPGKGHNCVDLDVTLVDDDYLFQGVKSYQSYGSSGTDNVKPWTNDKEQQVYKIDNVTSDEDNATVDCQIYLYTKYSAEYYTVNGDNDPVKLTDEDYNDSNIYINDSEDKAIDETSTTKPTENDRAMWMDWKTGTAYKTSITLADVPDEDESNYYDGWYLGTANGTKVEDNTFTTIDEASDNEDNDNDNIITFIAKVTPKAPGLTVDKSVYSITRGEETIYDQNSEGEVPTAEVGDTIVYQITVSNTGNVDLTGINVTDTMNDETVPLYSNASCKEPAADTSNVSLSKEGSDNDSVTYYATHTVNTDDATAQEVTNVAKAITTEGGPEGEDKVTVNVEEPTYTITVNYKNDAEPAETIKASVTLEDTFTNDESYPFELGGEDGYIPQKITTEDGQHYAFDRLEENSWTVTINNDDAEITAIYSLDSNEDGIPNKYQAKVTYKVVNGTWDGEDSDDQVHWFDLFEYNAGDNAWTELETPTLGETVPDRDQMQPAQGYINDGAWTPSVPESSTKVENNAVYTFTFVEVNTDLAVEKTIYTINGGNPVESQTGNVVNVGDTIVYKITITNEGNVDQKDIVLKDVIKAGTEDEGTSLAIYNSTNFEDANKVTKVDIDKGKSETFYVQYEVKGTDAGEDLINTVTANNTPDETEPIKVNNKYDVIYNANGGSYAEDASVDGVTFSEDHKTATEKDQSIGPHELNDQIETELSHDNTAEDVKVIFAGWTEDDSVKGQVYDKDAQDVPEDINSVTIENSDVTVYAIWAEDANGNGTPDYDEDLYTLTYDATSGYYGDDTADKTAVAEKLLGEMKYDLWTKDNDGTCPTDGTAAWPQHDNVDVDGESVAVEMVGWTTNEELAKTIYGRDSASVPQIYYNVPIEKANVTVYAVWGYDENNNGTPDISEKGATLTYNATSGSYSDGSKEASATKLLPRTYDLWNLNDEDQVIGQQPDNKELALPEHADTQVGNDSVIAPGQTVGVEFMGWTSAENAEAAQNTIYSYGEQYPDLLTDAEVKADETTTVYAVWGYDENDDGVADAMQIVIVPADMTIYEGGDGYEGILDTDGEGVGEAPDEASENGLPEPGYYLMLPYDLDNVLGGNDNTERLDGKLRLVYTNGDDHREWDLKLYNEEAGPAGNRVSTDVDRNGNGEKDDFYYVYKLEPTNKDYPVRLEVQMEDGTLKTTDTFTDFDIDSLYQPLKMRLYNTPGFARDLVTAQIPVDTDGKYNPESTNFDDVNTVVGPNTVVGIARGWGELTVRGTNIDEPVSEIKDSGTEITDEVTQITAVESGTEKNVYNVNGSDIPVINQDAVQFLADTIVDPEGTSTAQLKDAAQAENSAITDDYTFDFSYLDLVDTSNGNAYVTLADEENMSVDLYWPYPEDMDKSEPVYIVHYDGLDRDFNGANLAEELNKKDVSVNVYSVDSDEFTLTDTGNGYKITTSTFSPFAIVYKQEQSVTPDPGPGGGGDDDRPGLNLEDHYSYIVGYPEDYRTGEATDDEFLWPVKPQGKITRAEVATIFYRLLNNETRTENWTTSNNFTDVDADDWYNTPISTLSSMGIIVGYNDGSFQPNAPITRAEFAAIAVRFYQNNDVNYEEGLFTDIDGSEWFADAIAAAYEHGIIGGYVDGSFQPNNQITRAEAAAIVNRTTDRFPDKDHLLDAAEMRTWPDNADPDVWYYADIQEATNSHEYYKMDDPDGEEGDQIEQWTERGEDVDWDAVEAYQESVH